MSSNEADQSLPSNVKLRISRAIPPSPVRIRESTGTKFRGKAEGRGVVHPPPMQRRHQDRVELYLCFPSVPQSQVIWRTSLLFAGTSFTFKSPHFLQLIIIAIVIIKVCSMDNIHSLYSVKIIYICVYILAVIPRYIANLLYHPRNLNRNFLSLFTAPVVKPEPSKQETQEE